MESVAEQVKELMKEYKDEIDELLTEAAYEAAEDAAYWVSQTSPKKTGVYNRGWTVKRLKKKAVVYNADAPGLTHLLEYGHESVNQFGHHGRVNGIPHIKPAEVKGSEEFVKTVIEGLEKL